MVWLWHGSCHVGTNRHLTTSVISQVISQPSGDRVNLHFFTCYIQERIKGT